MSTPLSGALNTVETLPRHHRPCFIDTMRPIAPAEVDAWRFYLNLHRDAWRPAKAAFRAVHAGAPPADALLAFVAATGVTGRQATQLESVLQALAGEAGR